VIQFFILIGGALFTMGAIAYSTNSGLGDWIAASREHQYEPVPWFSKDFSTRSTVFVIALNMTFWTICTHGANQVALQRYFSVKNIWAARQSFLVNALCSFGLGLILAGVGIALMYFIQQNDLPAKAGIESAVDAVRNESQDKVFPQYIRLYLPAGIRGLVVAALFAAAMSTIDSGANSISTIISIDFFRRLKRTEASTQQELRLARILTASIGIVVVACTVWLYHISKGTDLITLCQKGFNCILGPLSALFVRGMFSSRSTARSMIPALLIGEICGICSSYSEELFGIPFSTHLVVPMSWLATLIADEVFSWLLLVRPTKEQKRWMWIPVVRSTGSSAEKAGGA
jgi:SSS family solute:Na+ symporter